MSLKDIIYDDFKKDISLIDFYKKNNITHIDVTIKNLSEYDILDKKYVFSILNMRKDGFDQREVEYLNLKNAIEVLNNYNGTSIRWIPFKIDDILCVYLLDENGQKVISKFCFKI